VTIILLLKNWLKAPYAKLFKFNLQEVKLK
jgi:hypothetical protein